MSTISTEKLALLKKENEAFIKENKLLKKKLYKLYNKERYL